MSHDLTPTPRRRGTTNHAAVHAYDSGPMRRALVAVASLLIACQAATDGSYLGEPLAEVRGTVERAPGAQVDAIEIVLFWTYEGERREQVGGQVAEVAGAFPATFRFRLYHPPAEQHLVIFHGTRMGVAYIAAMKPAQSWETPNEEDFIGSAPNHLLVYAPEGIAAGSNLSYILRSAPGPGYHLFATQPVSEEEAQRRGRCVTDLGENPSHQQIYTVCGGGVFDDFVPLPSGFDTPIRLTIPADPATAVFPNWT